MGHGCGGEGGVSPTLISYLRGTRASGAAVAVAGMATDGAVAGAGAATTTGEEGLTRGL